MINYNQIHQVHLEISSLCNASCPWCPRNFWGFPYNGGYPEVNFTLDNAKKIFSPKFLKQLKMIRINGNFGDIVMNPEGADIVEYFFTNNSNLEVTISTNGSGRSKNFWTKLARTKAKISFCLDGLNDTHHLYRQNTSWTQIIKNAKIFIDSGGHAIWKFIKFDHNKHQIEECRNLSKELGFVQFDLIETTRNSAPVFDKKGKLVHVLGNYTGSTNFEVLLYKKKTDLILLEDIVEDRMPKTKISCMAQELKEIYIAATGEVYPCCWTGMSPNTFGHGQYHQAANAQLIPLIAKNNALEYELKDCIDWFNNIKQSWQIGNYHNGRLVICDDNCGK
jgi:MoaA/NifB/PqqE/SkfB family radical SAM enzyme